MRPLRQFDIQIFKLASGLHEYSFEITDSFFEHFKSETLEHGNLQVQVTLTKSETMIEMNFSIKGSLELECDRSLDHFDFSIDSEKRMIYKLGHGNEELSDEIMMIDKDSQVINIADLLFEFISLEIPMKKLHPRFVTDEETEGELEAIYFSEEEEGQSDDQEEETDPRWAALKKLKGQ